MHSAKKTLVTLVVIVATILVFSRLVLAGGSEERSNLSNLPVDLPHIVIRVSYVQSGPSEFLGQKLRHGSMAYLELVNAHLS